MKKAAFLLFLFLIMILPAGAAPLRVVASFLPLYAATKSIGGDRIEVTDLAVGGIDPHDFSPKPSDLKKIAQADLLIVNGLGLETWLTSAVLEAGTSKLRVVDTSAGIAARTNPASVSTDTGIGPAEAGANPHVWLDPVLAAKQAANITFALAQADPANAAFYHANLEAYVARLHALDGQFRAFFSSLPDSKKNLITFHDAFPYFAARYGLHYLGSLEEFPEKAPSPKQLERLNDLIRQHHVGVLFAEEGYEPKLLRTLAAQTGALVAQLDTLEIGKPEADAYFTRMEANLAALRKAWATP